MIQTLSHHLLPVMLISITACFSHAPSVSDEEKDREDLGQTSECGDDERVLQSHLRHPRCDAAVKFQTLPV